MSHNYNTAIMKALCRQVTQARTVPSFLELIGLESLDIPKVIAGISYRKFKIKKRSGGFRTIEDPNPALKIIQSTINDFLQAAYYFNREKAAHGFVALPDDALHHRKDIGLPHSELKS